MRLQEYAGIPHICFHYDDDHDYVRVFKTQCHESENISQSLHGAFTHVYVSFPCAHVSSLYVHAYDLKTHVSVLSAYAYDLHDCDLCTYTLFHVYALYVYDLHVYVTFPRVHDHGYIHDYASHENITVQQHSP